MTALFQTVLMRLALCGLAASLLLLTLRSRMARDTFARLLSIWRSLTAFGRVAVCSFLLIGVLVGGDKTNSVNNLPPRQMMSPMAQHGSGSFLTGLSVNGNLANVMNLVQPQTTFAERKTANWNIRGAWKDSLWLDFEDDFAHTPAACSFPGEKARSWGALGEARPGQSSLSAGALRYRAWAQSWSSAALAARSVLPSNRPATPLFSPACWEPGFQAWAQSTCPELSAQGLVPLRWGCALPSPNAPGKAPNHIHTTLRWGRAPGKPSLAGACWAQTEDPSGCGAASPSQGRWDPDSLRPALSLGGQATAPQVRPCPSPTAPPPPRSSPAR